MRVTELHIQGYRTLKDVRWEPGALNVVIGPNASGKSNLLKFLRLISASPRADLNNQVLHEGGMGAILWDGRGEEVSFELLVGESELLPAGEFEYAASLRRLGAGASFVVDREDLAGLHRDETGGIDKETDHISRTQVAAQYRESGQLFYLGLDKLDSSETLLGQIGGPTSQSPEIRNLRQFLTDVTQASQ